jgi:peptide/nickel transport system substrate-binding protein
MNNLDPGADNRANQETLWYEALWEIDWTLDPATHPFTNEYITMNDMAGKLAASWESDYEAGTFTVKLQEGVKFQNKAPYNGRPLVAADVKWSYDRLLGTGSGHDEPVQLEGVNWPEQLYMIESIDAPDDATVVFHFKKGYANETSVNDLVIAEVNIAGPEWDKFTDDEKNDWHNAAGTGPFILDEYVLDNYMHFVKNEDYYGYDVRYPENKLPYLDEMTLSIVSESANRLTQFVSGELDMMAGTNPLNKSEIAQLQSTVDASKYTQVKKYSGAVAIGLKQTVEALKDVRVRRALQMALDTPTITSNYLKVEGDPVIMGLFSTLTDYSSVEGWDQTLLDSYAKFDPEGAKALLKEAGFEDGFTFDVTIFGALDADLFTLASTYLAEIGVTMNLNIAGNPMEMDQLGTAPDNQMCIFKNAGFSSLTRVQMNWLSDSPFNSVKQDDPGFDEMIRNITAATTIDDRNEAAKIADQYFADQHWILQLGGAEVMNDFFSSKIGGFQGQCWWRSAYGHMWVNK